MKQAFSQTYPRNLQLDFFRGLALMIIFVNHMPFNPWHDFTPSRLGPSDAAETFVFLSGFASALAFGRTFARAGLALGSLQVVLRCLRLYLAHLTLFLMMATLLVVATSLNPEIADWQLDNLQYFFDRTHDALPALLGLSYVPNFVDILPMYLIILLYLPMFWVLSTIRPWLAGAFSLSIYIGAWHFGWELTADPISGQPWYFNPFCWQLIFFTGYAFGSGWLPSPRAEKRLIWLSVLFVAFCFPLENPIAARQIVGFSEFRQQWSPLMDKSHLGLLRYWHFLALSYLAVVFIRSRPHWLRTQLSHSIIALGQQSLPVFMLGTCLSFIGGILLTNQSVNLLNSLWINIAGLSLMMMFAECLNWLELKPWKTATAERLPTRAPQLSWHWLKQAVPAIGLASLTCLPLILPAPTTPMLSQNQALDAIPSGSDRIIVLPENAVPDTDEAAFQASENASESPPDNI